MNPQLAEQLLYDSETTLRLVDSLLDELQVMEPELRLGRDGALEMGMDCGDLEADLSALPDLLVAAAAQARAVLDALERSRGVLERTTLEKHPSRCDERTEAPSALELRGGLERAILLVDRLDAENGPTPVRQLLREELLDMIEGVRAQEVTEHQLNYASSVLRETEAQLSTLVRGLSPRASSVIPFSTTGVND